MLVLLAALLTHARPNVGELHLQSARGYPFWVHAAHTDAATAQNVRDALDEFWYAEIVVDGWAPPVADDAGPDTGLDVYVDASLELGESYVDGETRVPGTTQMSSFMALPAEWESLAQLRSFVAHELNHTSQYAMNCDMDDAFFEHTAVWAEARAAGDEASWRVGVPPFQAHPERALTFLGNDEYEYGAALWLMYFTQDPARVQQLWRGSTNYFATLDGMLAQDRADFFGGFAGWRMESTPAPVATPLSAGDHRLERSLGMFGSAYWRIEAPPPKLFAQRGSYAALTLVALDKDGHGIASSVNAGEWQRPAGTRSLLIALTRVSPDYDASSRDFRQRRVRVTLSEDAAALSAMAQGLGGDADAEAPPVSPVTTRRSGCSAVGPSWLFVLASACSRKRWRQHG